MESVISLVLLAIVYSFYYIARSVVSKEKGVEGNPVTGEVFPNIELLDPALPAEPVTAVKQPLPQLRKERVHSIMESDVVSKNTISPAQKAEAAGKKFCLKGKSEARKAFIYSEILKRKY